MVPVEVDAEVAETTQTVVLSNHGSTSSESFSTPDEDKQFWKNGDIKLSIPPIPSPPSTPSSMERMLQGCSVFSSASATPTHRKEARDAREAGREIFVGDLSFFCREHDLVNLFSRFGPVERATIRYGENKKRSLMFGFVRMESPDDALQAMEALNNFLFMGRYLRVQLCNVDGEPAAYIPKDGVQIHVSFLSYQINSVYPTEEMLRSIFEPFGVVVDAIVCRYIVNSNPLKQSGYGFIYMESEDAASRAISELSVFESGGISFECSISHRSENSSNSSSTNKSYHHHVRRSNATPQVAIMPPPSPTIAYAMVPVALLPFPAVPFNHVMCCPEPGMPPMQMHMPTSMPMLMPMQSPSPYGMAAFSPNHQNCYQYSYNNNHLPHSTFQYPQSHIPYAMQGGTQMASVPKNPSLALPVYKPPTSTHQSSKPTTSLQSVVKSDTSASGNNSCV